MKNIQELINRTLIHMRYPQKKNIEGSVFITDEHIPRLQRGLLYIAIHCTEVKLLQTTKEKGYAISERVGVTTMEMKKHIIEMTELIIKTPGLWSHETSIMLVSLFEHLKVKGILNESDDLFDYLSTVFEYFLMCIIIFYLEDRTELKDGLDSTFTAQEHIDFQKLIQDINRTTYVSMTE
jgi:hypothetical protein